MSDQEKIKWLKFAVIELSQELENVKKQIPTYKGKDIHKIIYELVKDL